MKLLTSNYSIRFALASGALVVVQSAFAGSIIANYTYGLGVTKVQFSTTFSGNMNLGTTQFTGTRVGGTDTFVPNNFKAYCVEIGETLAQGVRTHPNVFPLLGSSTNTGGSSGPILFDATRTSNLKKLWGTFFGLIGNNAQLSAAFQLAQWELTFDDDLSLDKFTTSRMWVKAADFQPGITNVAKNWLAQIKDGTATQEKELLLLSGPGIQDQITPVPEPASIAGIGLGVLALLRRRKSK